VRLVELLRSEYLGGLAVSSDRDQAVALVLDNPSSAGPIHDDAERFDELDLPSVGTEASGPTAGPVFDDSGPQDRGQYERE
jgi:hypothetical protein